MADISKITLPSGTTYDIKDTVAREAASGVLKFYGITSTELTDQATTTTYVINGETHIAANGDLVIYGSKEFIYTTSDNKWHELGDSTTLGALAYKNSASGSYQKVSNVTVTTNSTENKTTTVSAASSGTTTYTPNGSVGTPAISIKTAGSTTTINNPTSQTVAKTVVAAAPGTSAPSNAVVYYDVNNETLSLYQIGYTTGASISTTEVTVKDGDAEYQASQPTWTGTGVRLVTGNIEVPSSYTVEVTETPTNITVS